MTRDADPRAEEVKRLAAEPRRSLASDVLRFVARTKKWWLVPLLLALVIFSLFALLGGTGLAPFIYPLF